MNIDLSQVEDLFVQAGGDNWYDRAVLGGITVIALLIFLVVVLVAFELRKPGPR